MTCGEPQESSNDRRLPVDSFVRLPGCGLKLIVVVCGKAHVSEAGACAADAEVYVAWPVALCNPVNPTALKQPPELRVRVQSDAVTNSLPPALAGADEVPFTHGAPASGLSKLYDASSLGHSSGPFI